MTDFDKRAQDHVEGRPDDAEIARRADRMASSWLLAWVDPRVSRKVTMTSDQRSTRWTRQYDSQTGSEGWVEIQEEPS